MNPNPIRFLLATAMLPVLLLCSCDRPESHPKDSGQRALDFPTNVTAYQVKGVLQEIRAGGRKALIVHEEIPGYMEAMTMQLETARHQRTGRHSTRRPNNVPTAGHRHGRLD
jgi:hypothetical protein